ncbi:MAG: MarR family transcriptional regulator, partial [Acholeplasmataceae bacterium]|nr:MarR family transcriptional regulator [Acholeplasmataceae bacterium]
MSRIEENLKLTTVLFRAIHGIERLLRNDIQSYGLNTTEFGVLELLYHQGEQPIQGICQKLLMANSSMT